MEIKAQIRALHRKYIREEEPNSVILNLKNWPDIDWCCIHEDKKAWGTYVRDGLFYNIGRNGCFIMNPIFHRDGHSATRKHFRVITDNPEVKRVYSDYYNSIRFAIDLENYYKPFFKMNPKLVTNLWDYFSLPENHKEWERIGSKVSSLYWYLKDRCAETIKDATGLPMKYFKTIVHKGGYYIEKVQNLKDLGYSPEEVSKYIDCYDYCPSQYLNNRKILDKFVELSESGVNRYSYRDYLRMISEFPDEIKKNFPLCPQDIQKQHDKAIAIYNRYQQQIRQARLKAIDDRYINDVYPLVKEYEFHNNNYVIIAPKSVFELSTEGSMLCHCVGSYINSVSDGRDYILFLRKKDSQDTPFFTINITPNKQIRQIHGKHNCNVPELLVPFIDSWMKKFNLTGTYGKTKNHL